MIKINQDSCYRSVATDAELALLLYQHPDLDLQKISVADPEKYNQAVAEQYLDWPLLTAAVPCDDPGKFHIANQQTWLMPDDYQHMDIAQWILDQCTDQNELQRAAAELLEYQKRDLMGMLRYLKYLVDTARANDIVLGVGRGSSVASFVLYLLQVHRIHSLRHNLAFEEFMR